MLRSPDDWLIFTAVVAESERVRVEREKSLADYQAAITARNTVRPIVRALGRLNKTLAAALHNRGR